MVEEVISKSEKRRLREIEKNDKIRKFCDGLEEEYREEFEEELLNFYRYFCDKLDTMYLGYKSGRFYEKFVNFVLENTSHLEEYKEQREKEFLEEITDEKTVEEEEDNWQDDYWY
jgi:hypothetical protein